jgi:uncharacterized protein
MTSPASPAPAARFVWGITAFLPIMILIGLACAGCGPAASDWPYVVDIGGVKVNVEVVVTDAERQRGLMHRKTLDENWGMLFVFASEEPRGFWMRNTHVPLSIAYFGRDRVAGDFQDMAPETDDTHPSKAPMVYALEVNQGWFKRRHVEPGAKVTFSPGIEEYLRTHPAD